MSIPESKYQSDIYTHFKEIRSDEYRSIIRFFETHEQQINDLDFREFYDLKQTYLRALYQIGAYNSFVNLVDDLIEDTIYNNIKNYQGRDIFQELLFKKACSHHYLREFTQAEHILKELIKIAPENQQYSRFLKRNYSSSKPSYVRHTRAGSVLIFMLTTIVIAVEILIVRNFWPEQTSFFEKIRNALFITGLFVLISGDSIHYWLIHRKTNQLLREIKNKKTKNSKRRKEREYV